MDRFLTDLSRAGGELREDVEEQYIPNPDYLVKKLRGDYWPLVQHAAYIIKNDHVSRFNATGRWRAVSIDETDEGFEVTLRKPHARNNRKEVSKI